MRCHMMKSQPKLCPLWKNRAPRVLSRCSVFWSTSEKDRLLERHQSMFNACFVMDPGQLVLYHLSALRQGNGYEFGVSVSFSGVFGDLLIRDLGLCLGLRCNVSSTPRRYARHRLRWRCSRSPRHSKIPKCYQRPRRRQKWRNRRNPTRWRCCRSQTRPRR